MTTIPDQFSPTVFGPMADPDMFTRPNAGDESLFVVFYMGVVHDPARTIEEGRPIYNDEECVRIIIPGDTNNVNDRPASEQDKRRFPKQYAMFKQGLSEEEQITGTRLTDWPFLSRAQAQELHHIGIRTVEQLAEVNDGIVGRYPSAGLQQLKRNAGVWLGKAKSAGEAAKIAKAMEEQDLRIEALQKVVNEQADRIEQLLEGKAKVPAKA